jgi:hypothetical protein
VKRTTVGRGRQRGKVNMREGVKQEPIYSMIRDKRGR